MNVRLWASALLLKVLYLSQYVQLPFLYGPLFDAQVYLRQARHVQAGEFGDPTLLAFSPLYGYLLAALGAGAGSIVPVLLQMALGLVNAWLVGRIARRAFGDVAGTIATLLYLGYAPLLMFESKLMSETCGLSLLLIALDLAAHERGRSYPATCAALAGGFYGLAILARASLAPGAALVALAIGVPSSSDLGSGARATLRRILPFTAALALILGAHGLWNQRNAGVFVPVILVSQTAAKASTTNWNGDLSVFRGEGEQAVGAFSVVHQARERLERLRRGQAEPEPPPFSLPGFLSQIPGKLLDTFRDRETSFDYGFYGEREEAWALRVPFVSFGLIALLSALGLLTAIRTRKWRDIAVPLAVALGTLLTTTLFHPSTRYRFPLLVVMLPLAGYACQYAWALEPARRRAALALLGAVSVGFATRQAVRGLDHPGLWQLRVAEAALEEGDPAHAAARIDRARSVEPNDPIVRQRAAMLEARLAQVSQKP